MKHRLITFMRIVRTGMQNFFRNATLAIAAMAVMVITLGIILFSVITSATFSNTIQQITNKIDVSVYLKDSVTPAQKDELLAGLRQLDNVKSVDYESKDQVLAQQKKPTADNLDFQLALAQIDNPFPATIHVNPKDPNKLQSIQSYLEKPDIQALQSSKTSYSGDRRTAVDKITTATKFLREAGFIGVVIFALVSMLIIFNTIRMAIFNRRDELQIMRLLGASTWYIRGPFVVETVIYGIVSAIISIVLCNAIFSVSSNAFSASSLGLLDIKYANQYFASHFWIILAGQLGIGILIGAASSYIATRRYLKFKTSK